MYYLMKMCQSQKLRYVRLVKAKCRRLVIRLLSHLVVPESVSMPRYGLVLTIYSFFSVLSNSSYAVPQFFKMKFLEFR
jgi:hypothetical protein